MTKTEKAKFIGDLSTVVLQKMHEDLDKVPDTWDGFELRQWLADRFKMEAFAMRPCQKADYNNDVTTHNL